FDRSHGEGDRDPAALLVGVVIRDGVAVLDRPHARDRSGREQQRLQERRLARSRVAGQQDVADVLRVVGVQRGSFRWVGRGWSRFGILPSCYARARSMVRFQRQPPGTALTRAALLGGGALAVGAAWFVVADELERAGVLAGLGGILLLVGG